jgi:hypothetical protein
MLPTREGRFKAVIIERGVDETGQNKLATFIARFRLTDELVNGEWLPLPPEEAGFEITGYFYLERKDGSINDRTVASLKSSLGWDGCDPFWLADTPMDDKIVQVTVESDEYEGKTKMKVGWINPGDSTGGNGSIPNASPERRRAIASRLGAKFRATGTPAPAPKPTTAAPKAAPARKPVPTATREQAWEKFCGCIPDGTTEEAINDAWGTAMQKAGITDDATPAQWASFIGKLPTLVDDVPF